MESETNSTMSPPAEFAFGPGLVGVLLNVLLHGILLAQAILYFVKDAARDSFSTKLLVLFVVMAETINCIFDSIWVYDNLVVHFGDDGHLQTANWVLATDPALVGIVSTAAQLFFARQVGKLVSDYLRWFIMSTSLLSGVFGIATAAAVHYVPRYADFQRFQAPLAVWLISTVVSDIATTAALTYYYEDNRRAFGQHPIERVRPTRSVLTRLILVTLPNGLLLTIWATVDLVVYLTVPTGLHLLFNFPLGKLYSNSLLLSLNMRDGNRRLLRPNENSSNRPNLPPSSFEFARTSGRTTHMSEPEQGEAIEMEELQGNAKKDVTRQTTPSTPSEGPSELVRQMQVNTV